MSSSQPRYRLEPLTEGHNTSAFDCELNDLNEYLHTDAWQDVQKHIANVFVVIDSECATSRNVAGYFALRAHALSIEETFFGDASSGDDAEAHHPLEIEVPLVELMWLARDQSWKGESVGTFLMVSAIEIVAQVSYLVGFIGLYLNATSASAPFYEKFGLKPFPEHPRFDRHYILPTSALRALANATLD